MTGRCEWAGCQADAAAFEDGYAHCAPHLAEHRNEHRERTCTGCFLSFTPARPNIRQCDNCRRVRVDRRPTARLRTKRSDAGRRRDIDGPLNRCRTCGEWRYSRQVCQVCAVAA